MRNWSIVTKIVVSACGIVCVLMILGGFVLLNFEIRMVTSFTTEIARGINQFIDKRAEEEMADLKNKIQLNAEILSGIGSTYLYNLDQDGMKQSLRPYMHYEEVVAIKVLDERGAPFAAVWRDPEVSTGDSLPADLALGKYPSIFVECIREGKQIGSFTVYYTDSVIKKKIQELKERAARETGSFEDVSRSQLDRAIWSQGVGVFLILLALVACLIIFLRALVLKRLKTVSAVANQLANFDLGVTIQATNNDEIGRLLRAIDDMACSFRNVVGQVQRSGIQVSSSSTELAATVREQEVTMVNQVASTDRMVKAVREISTVAGGLKETMQQVAAKSQETAGFASSGQNDLARMEEAMDNMEKASGSISGRLQTINEKAENITNVVVTITKVAEQTNLLSLNAAIEAEKAGEYGRGFNVVAREIRRLADQTAVATLDIEQMVQEMHAAVSAGVMEMDKFIGEVKRSSEDVGKISGQLARIIEQVQALSPSFENVNVSMARQSGSAQAINTAMVALSEEMRETLDSLSETYSAIEQLNEAARGLHDEVSRFKVG